MYTLVCYYSKNGLYVSNCFGYFCCIHKLCKICYFYFPSEETPSSIFILWLFSDFCINFCSLFFQGQSMLNCVPGVVQEALVTFQCLHWGVGFCHFTTWSMIMFQELNRHSLSGKKTIKTDWDSSHILEQYVRMLFYSTKHWKF